MLKSNLGACAGILMAMGFAGAGNALADAPVACSSINLRTAELHVKCMTSKKSVYERVSQAGFGEAWQGPDGVIWSDRIGRDMGYNAAQDCKKVGGVLPSRADFMSGEANGFREVLPNINVDAFTWSSSFSTTFNGDGESLTNDLYVFDGDEGSIYTTFIGDTGSVRCVESSMQ